MNRIIVLIVCLACGTFAQHVTPGIRINITRDGIDQLESIGEPLVRDYLKENEPFPLADASYSVVDVVELNITQAQLYDLNFGEFDLDTSGGQLQMTLSGLGAHVGYNLTYSAPFLHGSSKSVATLNQTSVVLLFNVNADNTGRPSIVLAGCVLSIGYLDPGLHGVAKYVEEAFNALIRIILDRIVPSDIAPVVNGELSALLANLSLSTPLPMSNDAVLFDYSLSSAPVLSEAGILIDIKGDIHTVDESTCPFPEATLDEINDRNFGLYVSQTVLHCALYAYSKSGALDDIASEFVKNDLNLDSRVGLQVNFSHADSDSAITVSPAGLFAMFKVDATLLKGQPAPPTVFITLDANIATGVKLSFRVVPVPGESSNVSLVVEVEDIQLTLAVEDYSSVPQPWYDQIKNTNFTELDAQANQFIQQTVLPQVNDQLESGFFLPQNVSQYLSQPEFLLSNGFLYVGFDFQSPSSPSSSRSLLGKDEL